MTEKNFEGMPLTAAIQKWMAEQKWRDEIKIAETRLSSMVATAIILDGETYRFFFECDEEARQISVFIYSPVEVPVARLGAMIRILNRINSRNRGWGRAVCNDAGKAASVQFACLIDVAGGKLSMKQVDALYSRAISFFIQWRTLFESIARSRRSPIELWDEFLAEEKRAEHPPEGASEI